MNNKHPISVVHIASGDLWAGAEVQLFTLVDTLSRNKNMAMHVILLNHGKLEDKLRGENINVTVIDESKHNGLSILIQTLRQIHRIKPDIIHTHRIKENILGSLCALLNGRIPSLRTVHGAAEYKPGHLQLAKRTICFLDWVCGRYLQEKIIAVSQDLADKLKKDYPENKISVIENGIDIATITKLKNLASSGSSPTVKIGIAGRLVPVKRVDLFIDTAKLIKQKHPQLAISFHIYGDGPLMNDLKQKSTLDETDDIVHFEGHSEHIHDALQTLDTLLMTSDHEGLPMVLLEAMALQIPIIAHNVGGIPDLLDNGRCGTLVMQQDPAAYASAINQLLSQKESKVSMAQHALDQVRQNYSAERNADDMVLQYHQLLA